MSRPEHIAPPEVVSCDWFGLADLISPGLTSPRAAVLQCGRGSEVLKQLARTVNPGKQFNALLRLKKLQPEAMFYRVLVGPYYWVAS